MQRAVQRRRKVLTMPMRNLMVFGNFLEYVFHHFYSVNSLKRAYDSGGVLIR